MFSVEPTLERTFFRSGAEALGATRPSLGAEELGLAAVGFLSAGGVPEGRGGVAVGLALLGAPAGGAVPGTAVLFFTELVVVLFGRLKSAGADFVAIFLISAGFPSVLIAVGLLGKGVDRFLLVDPGEARAAVAGALGAAWVLLEPGLTAGAEAGLDGETRFSGIFASATGLGFVSFEGKVEGLAVAAAGRLGGAAGTEPEARLMGFLFDPPKVVGAVCLGREVGCVLAFDVEVFAG